MLVNDEEDNERGDSKTTVGREQDCMSFNGGLLTKS